MIDESTAQAVVKGKPFDLLMTLRGDGLEPIRVTSSAAEIISRRHEFIPYPFDIVWLSDRNILVAADLRALAALTPLYGMADTLEVLSEAAGLDHPIASVEVIQKPRMPWETIIAFEASMPEAG
ncbi:MAG: hypothetical protein KIT16_18030 [Rhodospirillaceae bacterium]|nr:hypothetical protein [Rhodospirillaceae bacterium]